MQMMLRASIEGRKLILFGRVTKRNGWKKGVMGKVNNIAISAVSMLTCTTIAVT